MALLDYINPIAILIFYVISLFILVSFFTIMKIKDMRQDRFEAQLYDPGFTYLSSVKVSFIPIVNIVFMFVIMGFYLVTYIYRKSLS